MAEEKKFEATQSRTARARKEGDLPRSSMLSATVSFGCAAAGVSFMMPTAYTLCREALIAAASGKGTPVSAYAALSGALLIPYVCASVGSLAATFLQTRSLLFRVPRFQWEKLHPMRGIKRMFSRDALRSVGKACVAATVVVAAVLPELGNTLIADGDPLHHADSAYASLRTITVTSFAIGFVFGILDFLSEHAAWRRRLRMSFDEFKRDLKQSEGDPLMRGRRKQAHRMLVRGSVAHLKKAAFVLANPTHIAVALEYCPPQVSVPRVLIRAADEGALLVKKRAADLNIPVVENIAAARALFASCEVGSFIPRDMYVVMAEIVASLARRGMLSHES